MPASAMDSGFVRRDAVKPMEDIMTDAIDTPDVELVETEAPAEEVEGATPDAEDLGEGGKSAIQKERELARAADARAKAEAARANELAAKVKEFEDRDKTVEQKRAEELEATRKELAELTLARDRAEVAAERGVPANLLSGTTREEMDASATALLEFKGQPEKKRLVLPNVDKTPAKVASDEQSFISDFFGGNSSN